MESDEIDKANEEYEEKKRELGEYHPDTLESLNNLGLLFYDKGDYDRALPIYQELVKKSEFVVGEDNPHTITSLNNLALLFNNKGDYDHALPLYQKCLEKWERVETDAKTSIEYTRNIIAKLLKQMEEQEASREERYMSPPAAGGGRNKKIYFRKSKKSKLTKRSRNVRRSRNRKGGMMMTNSEIKKRIKDIVLDRDNKQINDAEYGANYNEIYSLWSSLGSIENKNQFAEEFVKAANTFFTDHSYRVPLYQRIIKDLRATDSHIILHPEDLRMNKSPPSLNVIHGGKSRRRRHNRRSSKKHKKARKSRRANRRHSRKH